MARTWKVRIDLFEADDLGQGGDVTKAHAVLTTSSGIQLDGHGRAQRAPQDRAVPEIGDELATARALRDLADRLLQVTSDDISALEHQDVQIER